jgi:FkbM family methyltransferase
MKTAHKIAAARLAYRIVHACRGLIGRGDEIMVTRDGLRYALDLAQGVDFAIYLFGHFEPSTARACARLVRPGAEILDIGANIGAHTLHLARLAGATGHVLAFEPTAYAFAKLQRNLALNPELAPRVTAFQCFLGAGDEARPAERIYAGWPLVGGKELHAKHRGEAMPTTGAVLRSLDGLLAERGWPRIDFVKLDVDGYECEVLAGAQAMLQRSRPVFIMELSPYVLEEHGASLARLMNCFLPLGYRFYRERDETPLPDDPAQLAAMIGDGASINAIARVVA